MLGGIAVAGAILLSARGHGVGNGVPVLAMPGVMVTLTILLVSLSAFRSSDLARYVWPLLAGVLVATLALLANEGATQLRRPQGALGALILIGVSFVLATPLGRLRYELETTLAAASRIWSGYAVVAPWASVQDDYANVQAKLPLGAKIATASDYPHLFDLRRNRIFSLDVPGSVSPPPGMPLRGTPAEMTEYMRGQDFGFVVATDPAQSACLYNQRIWQTHFVQGSRPFASWAPYFLDWFRWLEARTVGSPERVSYDGTLMTFDLREDP